MALGNSQDGFFEKKWLWEIPKMGYLKRNGSGKFPDINKCKEIGRESLLGRNA